MPDFITPAFAAIFLMIYGAPPADTGPAPSMPAAEVTPHSQAPDENTVIGGVKCQIEIKGSTQRSIVASATASQAPQSGTFTLEIQKVGANNAYSRQHGDFVLTGGETKKLATLRMSVGASETLSGHLLLNTNEGQTACEIK